MNTLVKLPNFIVIGAPKSGTTSLFFYLQQHPQIYLPVRKELHYFSYPLLAKNAAGLGDAAILSNLCATRADYEAHYLNIRNQTVIGEISPSYLYYAVQERIKQELGTVKIIVMLRNPSEKAYSQYMHMVRDQHETLEFYQALLAEHDRRTDGWSDIWRYAESSLYSDKLAAYLACFGREQVHIILFDDFVRNTPLELQRLFTFLQINPTVPIKTDTIFNRTGESKFKWLARFLSQDSRLKKGLKMIIPEPIRIALRLKMMNANTQQKIPMDEQARSYLQDYFAEDIKKLEVLLERSLDWN